MIVLILALVVAFSLLAANVRILHEYERAVVLSQEAFPRLTPIAMQIYLGRGIGRPQINPVLARGGSNAKESIL